MYRMGLSIIGHVQSAGVYVHMNLYVCSLILYSTINDYDDVINS